MDIFKRAKKKAALVRAYKDIFSSEQGKLVLDDLIKECNFVLPVMAESEADTFFNEGKRNVFLYIMHKMNLDPNELFKRIVSEGQSTGEEE